MLKANFQLRKFSEYKQPFLGCPVPAKAELLVEQHGPVAETGGATLKPRLAAEDGREAGGSRDVAGRAAFAQVGQQQAGAGALAHRVDAAGRLAVSHVAYRLPQVRRVAELLQLWRDEGRPVVAAAVEDDREVAVVQARLAEL